MQDGSFIHISWEKVGLAILPGLFAIGTNSGLFRLVLSESISRAFSQNGLIAVCILLSSVGFIRERQLAVWSFPALGLLLFEAWRWIPPPFVDQASPFWQVAPPILVLAGLAAIAALAVYRVYKQHGIHIPRLGWVLLCLIILVTVAEVIASTIADRSPNKWTALLAVLPPLLWWMGMTLLPIAIGLPLARRDGLPAGLFVVAAEFVLVDGVFDPAYALGIWTPNQAIVIVVSVIPAVFFLVVSPIWVLRSRSTRGRVWGLLLPAFIALVSAEVISGTVRPYYSIDMWLTRGIGAAQFLIAIALAAVITIGLNAKAGRRPIPKLSWTRRNEP